MIACPSEVQLRAFHDGSLSDPELDAVASHLAGCPACEAAISRIESGPPADPLQAGFRALKSQMLADTAWDSAARPAAAPARCGRYELRDRLGVGGMGVVYRAWDPELKRFAAVKVLRAGGAARPDELTRFQREAELLARLRHPNLVEVYEAGTQGGQPYLAMELVSGGSLADRLDAGPLPARAAAELVRSVARAVQAAHLCGITHRDIKPANILLSGVRSQGTGVSKDDNLTPDSCPLTPKLSDFGLARLDDPDGKLTQTGMAAGTPAYMAPEQVDARLGPVGPPADVWALGAVLYECLAGRRPFAADSSAELFPKLLEEDPAPLVGVPRDLAVVCLKCLRKAPADRYPTAGELADDLDRFLAGEPVRARPVGAVEAAWKWAKRRPWVAGLSAGLVGVTAVGTIGIAVALVYALAGWDAAARREQDAVAARDREAGERDRAERQLYFSRIAQAELRWRANDVRAAASLLAACPPERRGWEWHYLDGLLHSAVARADAEAAPAAWHPAAGYVDDLTFTADGRWLLTGGGGNPFAGDAASGPASVRLWDPATGAPVGPPLAARAGLRAVAVSPDGRTVAALERTGTVRRWAAADGRELGAVGGLSPIGRLVFRPDGGLRLFGLRNAGGSPHRVAVEGWDAVTGQRLWAYDAPRALGPTTAAWVSVAGHRAAFALLGTGGGKDRVVTLDPDTGAVVGEALELPGQPTAVALSADGTRVAVHSHGLRVFDTATNRLLWSARVPAPARSLAFSPDGRTLAAGLTDRTVRTWEADTGAPVGLWRGNPGRVMELAFHPDGRRLAAGCEQDGGWAVWDLTRPQECVLARVGRPDRSAEGIGFGTGGRELLAAVPTKPLQRVDPATGSTRAGAAVHLSAHWQAPGTLAVFAADGAILVGKGPDPRAVVVWDAATGAARATLTGLGADVHRVAASADGRRVAAAGLRPMPGDRHRPAFGVRVWEVDSGAVVFDRVLPTAYPVVALALSADGARLAVTDSPDDPGPAADRPVRVRVFDVPGRREEWSVTNPAPVWSLAFDGPGRRLAAGDGEGHVRLWDAADGRALTPAPLSGPGYALAFSPDGARLAGADRDQVRLWDAASGEEVFDLPGVPARPDDDGYNPQLAWSPDGRRLAAIRFRGHVALWDAGPRR